MIFFRRFHGATPGYSPVPFGPAAAAIVDAPAAADDAADPAGDGGASHSAAAAAGKERPARGWFEGSRFCCDLYVIKWFRVGFSMAKNYSNLIFNSNSVFGLCLFGLLIFDYFNGF